MENLLEVRGLCKHYSGFSLQDINLTVKPGCIVGLIGENGAGKTTTLKAATHVIFPDSGTIRLMGQTPDRAAARSQMAVVFEDSFFYGGLTLLQVEKVMAGIGQTWDRQQFFRDCRSYGLPEKKPIKDFSRGMRIKLNLATAMARHPRLLILDEATSGLDPVVRGELMDVFLEFIQDEECSVLLSSHITDDLERVADEIAYIHEGRLLFQRNKDELLESMAILRCPESDMNALPPELIVARSKDTFSHAALVEKPKKVRALLPEAVLDKVTLGEMMQLYSGRDDR